MRCVVTVELPGRPPEPHALAAPVLAGGSRADALLLPGAAAGALRLVPVAAGLVVEALAAGVRAAGHPLAPGSRRLLRPGERAELQGAALVLTAPPRAGGATRVAAAALLRDAASGAAPVAGPHLLVLSGPASGERHALGAEQTLGRGRAATIRLPDPHASRVHARVRLGPRGATIEDLRSKNGVRVDGVAIERRPVPLAPGAEIRVGETLLALVDGEAEGGAAEAAVAARGDERPGPAPRRRARPPARFAAALLLAVSAAALALAGS